MADGILSQARLKELLHYDPDMGVFTWRVNRGRKAKAGSFAGTLSNEGYVAIMVDGKSYQAHRLAWLYVHGTFPPTYIDHVNRVKTENRIGNLRLATQAENMQNQSMRSTNTSGHTGVHWYKQTQKWGASICFRRKQIHLGYFANISEAIAAREAANVKYHNFQHAQP